MGKNKSTPLTKSLTDCYKKYQKGEKDRIRERKKN
jgi:hypothetical protein